MTMTSPELYAQARENVNELLKSSGPDAFHVYAGRRELELDRCEALNDLLSVRKDLEQEFKDVRRTIDAAEPYLRGEAGMFSSCGLLQASGPAIDRLAAVFTERLKVAVKAELAVLRALDRAKS